MFSVKYTPPILPDMPPTMCSPCNSCSLCITASPNGTHKLATFQRAHLYFSLFHRVLEAPERNGRHRRKGKLRNQSCVSERTTSAVASSDWPLCVCLWDGQGVSFGDTKRISMFWSGIDGSSEAQYRI